MGRVGYAFSRVLITRCDSRQLCFNASTLGGNFASSAVSNLYYPANERTVQNTMIRFGQGMMTEVLNNLIREFVPDLVQRLQQRKAKGPKAGPGISPVPSSRR